MAITWATNRNADYPHGWAGVRLVPEERSSDPNGTDPFVSLFQEWSQKVLPDDPGHKGLSRTIRW